MVKRRKSGNLVLRRRDSKKLRALAQTTSFETPRSIQYMLKKHPVFVDTLKAKTHSELMRTAALGEAVISALNVAHSVFGFLFYDHDEQVRKMVDIRLFGQETSKIRLPQHISSIDPEQDLSILSDYLEYRTYVCSILEEVRSAFASVFSAYSTYLNFRASLLGKADGVFHLMNLNSSCDDSSERERLLVRLNLLRSLFVRISSREGYSSKGVARLSQEELLVYNTLNALLISDSEYAKMSPEEIDILVSAPSRKQIAYVEGLEKRAISYALQVLNNSLFIPEDPIWIAGTDYVRQVFTPVLESIDALVTVLEHRVNRQILLFNSSIFLQIELL